MKKLMWRVQKIAARRIVSYRIREAGTPQPRAKNRTAHARTEQTKIERKREDKHTKLTEYKRKALQLLLSDEWRAAANGKRNGSDGGGGAAAIVETRMMTMMMMMIIMTMMMMTMMMMTMMMVSVALFLVLALLIPLGTMDDAIEWSGVNCETVEWSCGAVKLWSCGAVELVAR
jgi:hypothetical protein